MEVLAGAACGFLAGMVFLGVGSWLLVQVAGESPPIVQELLRRVPVVTLALPISFITMAAWALIGVLAGLLYQLFVVAYPGSGPGTDNMAFTLLVVILNVVTLSLPMLFWRRFRIALAVLLLTFSGIFGWLLPLLAS